MPKRMFDFKESRGEGWQNFQADTPAFSALVWRYEGDGFMWMVVDRKTARTVKKGGPVYLDLALTRADVCLRDLVRS